MTWRYIDPLLEKAARHSTIFGKYWATIIVIFRLTMLTFAERAWSDEQKEFRCNTKEVGCENVCFNQFAPISNVRLWGLQLLGCCIPACLYLVYVLNLVSRAQNEDRERKNAMKIQKNEQKPQLNQNNNIQTERKSIESFASNPLSEQNNVISFRKIQKFQKKQRKYARFNTMIIPAEYRSDAAAKSSMERKIWRFYIYQIIFRTAVDFAFLTVQWHVYPYRFIVPEIFVCSTDPCPYQVNCFISRPTEKTIFFNYKYIIGLITCIINFLEIWYIGWIRIRFAFRNYFQNDSFLRRAFQEDPSPPYFGMNVIQIRIFCIKYIFHSVGAEMDANQTQAPSECFSSAHDSMSLPPIPPSIDIQAVSSSGIRKLSKDQFSPLEPISASNGSGSDLARRSIDGQSGRSSSKTRKSRKQNEQQGRKSNSSNHKNKA
ncbi:unnamed protein product [Oikopleura dioica]|uniref:Gap junction protein n=1 Tax=Oikopleura dioica TaxID=34765 RepID=E4WSZ4_OIKDI|nr:unnamed protein product [Oikopleura dioica]